MSWPVVKLDEVTTLVTCGVAKRPEYVKQGVPFLSAKNVKRGNILFQGYNSISEKAHTTLTKYNKPVKGDILYTRVGSVGEAAVIEDEPEFSIFVSLTLIKPIFKAINSYFLKYLLNSAPYKQRALDNLTGIGVGNLNVKTVRGFPVPLPPLEEQKRIVALLDQAQALISKRKEQITLLDDLSQSLFYDMFGDPDQNSNIPVVELDSVCTKITDGTHQSPNWAATGYPFLFVSNVRNRKISFETSKFIAPEEHLKLTRNSPIEKGDLLYTVVGSYGHPAVVKTDRKFAFQRHIAHLKPNFNLIDSLYLESALNSPYLKRQADARATGVAQKTLILKELKKLKIIDTPLELQQKFADSVQKIETQKEAMQASLVELENNFNSIMQRAFKGEL